MASEREALAGLTVLVAVAKADGKISREEVDTLEQVLEERGAEVDLKKLLHEKIDLASALSQITDEATRKKVYVAAAAMALADHELAPQEDELLRSIREAWSIGENENLEAKRLALLAHAHESSEEPALVLSPDDAAARTKTDIRITSVLSAAIGAIPVPFFPDLAVLVAQHQLVDRIARYYGVRMTAKESASVIGGVLGVGAARVAISSIMKIIPVWGSVVGASTAFATTWALGTALARNLSRGGSIDAGEMKKEFEAAKEEGERFYKENQAELERDIADKAKAVRALNADLETGKISQQEFDARLAALA